jgi:acyl carrier protein
MNDILAEVRRIMAQELAVPGTVAPDAELASFPELDSLGLITLAVGLEDRFRVRLTGADAQGIVTVRDLVDLVARRLAEDGR